MEFHYRGKDKAGGFVEGTHEAADKLSLARELREAGILVVAAEPAGGNPLLALLRRLNESVITVKLHEKIVFARNLSAMISAGIPVSRSLAILEKQTVNQRLVRILKAVGDGIAKGSNLSDGLKQFGGVFSPLFVAMVRAGEESGTLARSLREIAENLDRTYTLTRKVRGALIYPVIIIVAIIVIGALMLIFVVPTLTATFRELKVELPWSTKLIIFISDLLTHYTLSLLAGLVLLAIAIWFALKTPRGREALDWGFLHMPIIGGVVRDVNTARTARTLSSLLSSGVSVTESLGITNDVLQNSLYQRVVEEATELIKKGSPLSQALKGHSDLYPVMVGEMVEVGEETGKLAEMLKDVASFYEDEVEIVTKDLSTVIEPLLMIIIGTAVGFFALSVITPTYSLLNNI